MDDTAGRGHRLNVESLFDAFHPVPEQLAAAEEDRHHSDVQVIDQIGVEEFPDGGGAAADPDIPVTGERFGSREASAGSASMKWKVVPPSISRGGRGWLVRTITGVWKGGLSPHQPRHCGSGHGPDLGANLWRPMISAPMLVFHLLAKVSSVPVVPI